MRALSVRGVNIGEGRPKAVVSLMGDTVASLAEKGRRALDAGADLLEWRADYLDASLAATDVCAMARELRAALPEAPLLFTFRSEPQGGQRSLPLPAYLELNQALVQTGAIDLVDVELGVGEEAVRQLVAEAHGADVRVIVSQHDFCATPAQAEMVGIFERMAALGADIPKLATMARDGVDCLRLMSAAAEASGRLSTPLLALAMGEAGRPSRLTGESFGSALTFCACGEASAPGQVELGAALAAMDGLHAALAVG